MSFVSAFGLFVLLICGATILNNTLNKEVSTVTVKGKNIIVLDLPDKNKAARLLYEIGEDLQRLVNMVASLHPNDLEYQNLKSRFNADNISEGSPNSGYTSYSINKTKMILCIRNSDMSFVDKNTIMYVAIHELGHIMTTDVGHTKKFWSNFKRLLSEAEKAGFYKYEDYAKTHTAYCSITISQNVLK